MASFPTTDSNVPAAPGCQEYKLDLTVVFTSAETTGAALKRAAALAGHLRAHITLVVPQIVPYPLPLTSPPVPTGFNERRFHLMASGDPNTTVNVYLCRDRSEILAAVLKPRSLVVLGGRRRWWPTIERRLARKLRRAGHEVVLVEME